MFIGKRELEVPIIQGGMGVGVSLSGLAGAVAKNGGMGIISSVNAGYREEDFEKNPVEANLRALRKEIMRAKEIAGGKGLIGVNIMTAVSHYEETARCAVEAGADVIISGAGLPLKLPEYVKGSNTMFAPIVSSKRAAALLLRQYQKTYNVKPDFMVIEGHEAGGHLGFGKDELLQGTTQTNKEILSEVLELTKPLEIPVFVGGGVFDGKDMAELMDMGAAGVQIGTRFIVTEECDAATEFKQVIIDAKKEDILIIKSPVGMPARAIRTPLLERLSEGGQFLAKVCNGCLSACPRGKAEQVEGELPFFCISRALVEAVKGNVSDGLFFTGSNAYRIDKIVTVKELMREIMEEYSESSIVICGSGKSESRNG